jgi:hypothetical protein
MNHRALIALALLLPFAFAPAAARADADAARTCAEKLSPDARSIFDAALPQVGPEADMRSLLTDTTRRLAFSGTIGIGSARESATAASQCLQLATN